MGRWSSAQHRGGGGSAQITPSVVLADAGGGSLTWTLTVGVATRYNLEESVDGVSGWFHNAYVTDADQPYAPGSPDFFRLTAENPNGVPITPPSNVVQLV